MMAEVDYPWAIPFWSHPTNVYFPASHGGVPNKPRAFCLHTPEEPAGDNYPGTPIWFAKPNVGGSTHYFVEAIEDPNRPGFCKVYQCVPETHGAIANGKTIDKPWPDWADRRTSLNWQTLSVEIEGYAATIQNTLMPMQLHTVADLVAHRAAAHGFPTDRAHVFGHYEVASNRTDPGARFPWDALIAALQAEEPEEEEMFEVWSYGFIDVPLAPESNPSGNVPIAGLLNLPATDHDWQLEFLCDIGYVDVYHGLPDEANRRAGQVRGQASLRVRLGINAGDCYLIPGGGATSVRVIPQGHY